MTNSINPPNPAAQALARKYWTQKDEDDGVSRLSKDETLKELRRLRGGGWTLTAIARDPKIDVELSTVSRWYTLTGPCGYAALADLPTVPPDHKG